MLKTVRISTRLRDDFAEQRANVFRAADAEVGGGDSDSQRPHRHTRSQAAGDTGAFEREAGVRERCVYFCA